MVIVVSIFLFVVLLTIQFFPRYWEIVAPVQTTELANGLTKDGHPWIGAESPELIITEYTDYLCFQCKKMHFFLRRLIAEHPQKIRLVHRNYPMDHKINPIVNEPFHEGAGSLALIAIYAATQDKFWIMNDRLFEMAGKKRTIDLKELAVKTGLNFRELKGALQDTNIRNQLNRDILSGMKLGINGTPAYLIDDKLYLGQIPPDILKKALE